MSPGVLTVLFLVSILGFYEGMAADSFPLLKTSELRGFETLEEPRQRMIEVAIEAGHGVAGMPYQYGGNGSKVGGFDCSGAMYHVMQKVGLPPQDILWPVPLDQGTLATSSCRGCGKGHRA